MNGNKANFLAVVIVLIAGAFYVGLEIGQKKIVEVAQVSNILNKEGDVLTAQVGVEKEQFDFTPYWRVWNTLEKKFIPFGTTTAEQVSAEDRMYRSIEGLVNSYADPYTIFMRPQVAEDFKISTKGSLEGIGAVIGEQDGVLVVVGPLKDSPAEKAGLISGDKILSVDDILTEGMSVDDSVKIIRGERGTEVKLSIKTNEDEPRDVFITRGTIEIPSTAHAVVAREVPVASQVSASGDSTVGESSTSSDLPEVDVPVETELKNFYVLRLFSFSQTSINSFERELLDFVESDSDSLIIDLRGNPGGYIESAVQIASWFLNEGDVVVREYHGPDKREIVHVAKDKKLFAEHLPSVAVLVDKGSASASEILAGALQEHGVATVVGTNTYGKGSVQELISITDTLSLKVTVARWYTPNGVSISQGGLTPDVIIDPSSSSSTDPWLDAAVEALSS